MNKIFIVLSFLSLNINAAETNSQYGRVVELKGSGFISYQGKTSEMVKGQIINSGSEIVIEHQGQVTFTDNSDHRFHLGNSSSVLVSHSGVELRSGDLWVQSLNKNDDYKIQTANAIINYQGGEAILSYDLNKGKTQLMVINGMMKLSNLRAPELNLNVAEGHFSFIDNSYEEGAPRDPTQVGEKTYGQLLSLFNGIQPLDKNSENLFKKHEKENDKNIDGAHRSIASVGDKKSKTEEEQIEAYKASLLKTITNKKSSVIGHTNKKNIKSTIAAKNDSLIIHIYGQVSSKSVATKENIAISEVKSRAPASVLDEAVPVEKVKVNSTEVSPYSKDFKKQYKESDKLIDDLKKL